MERRELQNGQVTRAMYLENSPTNFRSPVETANEVWSDVVF